jgi:hypothetical protein
MAMLHSVALGQSILQVQPMHTFQNAATATGNGTELGVQGWATVGVQVVLSGTATVVFEGTTDGSNYTSVSCTSVASTSFAQATGATSSGLYACPVAGLSALRVRISAYSSGTVTAKGLTVLAKRGGAGGGGSSSAAASIASSTTLPASCTVGDVYVDTDATSGSKFYYCDTTDTWVALKTSETQTLDNAFDQGKVIDGANSLANAVRIGDGSTPICIYTDATLGPQVRPCTDANVKTVVPTNFTWALYDEEGASAIETVDPDAASVKAVWTYATAYRPVKPIYFGAGALSTDGTNCAAPAEVTINSGAKMWTILCGDNDSSTIYGQVAMPPNWDGGTVTMTGSFIQTAADTSNMNADVAMACRKDGDTVNNTWGTEIAMDTAMGGSNKRDSVQTAAITPNGTCTGGTQADPTLLQFRWQLDATGTTTAVATMHITGFTIWYSETSRSN